MALGTARPQGSSGEFFSHCTGLRTRVIGSGTLRFTLFSPDAVNSQVLPTITMASTNRVAPLILANFIEQRMQYEFKTTAKDETLRINRVILYMKPFATMEPA